MFLIILLSWPAVVSLAFNMGRDTTHGKLLLVNVNNGHWLNIFLLKWLFVICNSIKMTNYLKQYMVLEYYMFVLLINRENSKISIVTFFIFYFFVTIFPENVKPRKSCKFWTMTLSIVKRASKAKHIRNISIKFILSISHAFHWPLNKVCFYELHVKTKIKSTFHKKKYPA